MGSRIKLFLCLVVCLVMVFSVASAQTYGELFRQKKTQEKYLIKQLAYLKLYAGYVKKGYDIVGSGLNTIKGITSGEFGLHEAFFGSLKLVSPIVKKDYRVLEMVSMQLRISRAFAAMAKTDIGSENLTYVHSVRENLISECNKDLDELVLVVTSSKVEMDDEQRLSRLSKVYGSMLEKLEFVMGFLAEIKQLEQAMESEKSGVNELWRLYEKY
ncbi:hypothetical protein ACHMWN_08660 [Pedobacter sp. UC225_61]|uniref:hypothetical protein n=1 Tax=Pedobacter sp. UC225_61 TaxID=3374623 RepID=UPI003795BD7C